VTISRDPQTGELDVRVTLERPLYDEE